MHKLALVSLFMAALLAVAPAQAVDTGSVAEDDKAFDDYMTRLQAHMRQMQQQMQRIHATTDPSGRQRLMQEHYQSMQQGMAMMRGTEQQPGCGMMGHPMMGGRMMGGPHMHGRMMGPMRGWNPGDTSPQGLNRRQQMIGACMGLQQQMMEQMLQHQPMMTPR